MAGPLTLGIHWAHDASVAICSPDGIVCVIPEERITRLKHYYGFPYRAIETALKYCGLSARDIDIVAFSSKSVFYPEHSNYFVVSIDGTLIPRSQAQKQGGWQAWVKQGIPDELGLGRMIEERRDAKAVDTIRKSWGEFADRHYYMARGYLSDLGLMEDRVAHYYVPHHRAHAASAFRLSGLEEACVVTVDGKGDGLCATVYRGHRDGRMELLRSSPSKDSLGSFYQAATEALGFIPVDGEYKTMGLAALGSENGIPNPFKAVVRVEEGLFKSSIRWKFRSFNEHNPSKTVPNPLSSVAQTEDFKKVLEGMPREQFAYFAQEHCEENMLNFARDAMRITGLNAIAAAGGVMLNVKANALIRDELNPSSFFVFPDSADGGLAAGAAMEALYQARALSGQIRFRDPYLGHSFSDEAILDSIEAYRGKHGLNVTEAAPGFVADYLAQGKVLGTFQGRLEMGPRALGNRSVLADPRSDSAKDRINLLLKGREWFVPFAPALLAEDANLYWDGSVDYRYMTFAVKASKYAREVVPAVVHVDGTMRPEVVSRDYNPWLYDVLSEFKKRTGVGVLLNTSFNRHGLPIVGSPADALDHLINGWVDGLSIGRWYVERA